MRESDQMSAPGKEPGKTAAPAASPKEVAGRRLASYLERFPIGEERRAQILSAIMGGLGSASGDNAEELTSRAVGEAHELLAAETAGALPLPCPESRRGHMVPEQMKRSPWQRPHKKPEPQGFVTGRQAREYLNEPWMKKAARRRLILSTLVFGPTA